jgi:hypothetical protein
MRQVLIKPKDNHKTIEKTAISDGNAPEKSSIPDHSRGAGFYRNARLPQRTGWLFLFGLAFAKHKNPQTIFTGFQNFRANCLSGENFQKTFVNFMLSIFYF